MGFAFNKEFWFFTVFKSKRAIARTPHWFAAFQSDIIVQWHITIFGEYGDPKTVHKDMGLYSNEVGRNLGEMNKGVLEDEMADIIYQNIYSETTEFIWLHEWENKQIGWKFEEAGGTFSTSAFLYM